MNEKEYYDQQEAFLKGMSKEVALAGAEAYWMSMTSTFFRNPAQAIAELVDNGTEIHLFVGNHDLWTGEYLKKEIGIIIHQKPKIIKKQGKKIYIEAHIHMVQKLL